MNEDNEDELFSQAVEGVKPLRPHNLAETPLKNRERPRREPQCDDVEMDEAGFVRSGIQKSVLRKLRNGQIPSEDELDLHGCTVAEAERLLGAFLMSARAAGRQRAVRVIHGKGLGSPGRKSVLKEKVAEWLHRNEAVLACSPARETDGGSGAVHVLLRRR